MTAANGGNDHFFKKDTPHGLVKRFMWKKHVQTFIAMTQRSDNFDTTIIFDGFAGAGRYGSEDEWPDEIEKYGSPLISLRAAKVNQSRMLEVVYGCVGGTGWCSIQPVI